MSMKSNPEPTLNEFKFHYHFDNAVGHSDKYFLAHSFDEAKEMFDYACCKRQLHPQLDKVEMWNRWSFSWENIKLSENENSLN